MSGADVSRPIAAALLAVMFLAGVGVTLTAAREEKQEVPVTTPTKSDLLCINKDTVSLVMRERDYIEVRDRGLFVSPQLNEPTYYYVAREGDLCIIEESQPNPLGERL